MKRIFQQLLITKLLIFTFCFSVFTQSEIEMEEDAEKIHDLYKEIRPIKEFRLTTNPTYQDVQESMNGMNRVRLLREKHGAFVKGFVSKYASNTKGDAVWRYLDKKFEPLDLGYGVGTEYDYVASKFELLDTAGNENASKILKDAQYWIDNPRLLKGLHEIYRVKKIEEILKSLNLATLIDVGNARVERRAARLQVQVEEALKEFKADELKTLQSRTWKGNIGSTSAGSPVTLATAGKRFLDRQSDWGGNTKRGTKILKVSIIGDWFVAERSFGRPTRYGLPAAVAVKDNTMGEGIVTVYEVSLITREPIKNTNFLGVWVGKVWRMLDKNLPK